MIMLSLLLFFFRSHDNYQTVILASSSSRWGGCTRSRCPWFVPPATAAPHPNQPIPLTVNFVAFLPWRQGCLQNSATATSSEVAEGWLLTNGISLGSVRSELDKLIAEPAPTKKKSTVNRIIPPHLFLSVLFCQAS